jgi:hypothetical protein
VGACHRTLPATAPACYAHHWERAPSARQQCLAPLHQIATAGTILSRRLPPPAGAGWVGGVSQITAGHAARTRCWFRLRQVGVGAYRRTLPATAPACYAHHWERAPPAHQQCLTPLHQIAIAGTVLPRRLPPPAGAGGGGGVSQITAGHAARTRCWFRLRQVGVGACRKSLPATAPACYAHHWERAPPARQQCLAPLHQIATAGTILSRRLPPPAGAGGGGGVSQITAGHSTSVLRAPLGAHASGAPTVSRTPTSDRNSGNHPAPAAPAPSGGGWGWGRVANHCRPLLHGSSLWNGTTSAVNSRICPH